MFEKWARKTNYSKNYFKFFYDSYIDKYEASYPCDYYSIDHVNSVYDDEYLQAGTYEKYHVGELSGMRWNKIFRFPLLNVEGIQPTMDSNEQGLSYKDTMISTITFPEKYGLIPNPGDFVDLSFAFTKMGLNSHPIFVITNINLAHIGNDNNLYQLPIRISSCRPDELEKQINNYYMFYDLNKKILPLTNVKLLNKITNRYNNLSQDIFLENKFYDNKLNMFVDIIEEELL